MAERPAGDPPAGADGSDAVLATKLYVPRLGSGFVARPRLVERLEEGLSRGLVLVCAPAGFGKTGLVADWAQRGRRPVAWLSLDAGDNDPTRFWRHLLAALERARPGLTGPLGPLLGPPAPASYAGLVTALINQLASSPDGEVLVVLDDYHLVEAPPVHASVRFLVAHRPPGLGLVVASRADPPLGLARLRAHGQLTELRAAELRFGVEEAAALLGAVVGPGRRVPEGAVAALTERTEGWVAGLQLAGLSLQGRSDVGAFVEGFSGSHRYVLDFLAEEVLARQPDELVRFLIETSVLERLSGPLCDAVCGRTDSQVMLERIERANLFLVPLDAVRGWWRYHQLFADLLRVRLAQEGPERVAGLHRAAAGWFAAHGLADDAVHHALAAGDAAWAARLVERHADAVLLRSERATLVRWLDALPAEVVAARPRLLLAQALSALVGGRAGEVGGLLDAAERAMEQADEPFQPSVGQAGSLLVNPPALLRLERAFLAELHGDADRQSSFGRRALAEVGEDERTLGAIIRGHLGVAEWLGGRLPEAAQTLAASIGQLRALGERFLAVRVCEHLGQAQRAQGDLEAAVGTYRLALEIAAPPGQPALPAAGIARVGMAEVAYQRGQLDTALGHLDEGIEPCRQLIFTQPVATGLATLAWIRQAQGDPAAALDAMEEAARVAPGLGVASTLNPVPALRARLQLAQGDLAAAADWSRQRGLDPDDEPSYPREPEQLVLARVLLAQDRPDQALGLLERLAALAVRQRRTGSLIELRALQALALAARGQEAAAVAALAEALRLAHPQGYVRVFADEGPPMGALLGRLLAAQRGDQTAAGIPLDYLGRLARALDPAATGAGPPAAPRARSPAVAVPGLVEQLSSRELEVLRLLAAGRPNQEIAEELVVALSTVKKHVTHILDKLGATNRTQATARARELGLLP